MNGFVSVQKVVKTKWNKDFKCGTLKMSAKKLEKGIDINDLSPVDLRLSIVKTLTAEFLLQTYNDIKADKKLIYKGRKKAGIAKCVGYWYRPRH